MWYVATHEPVITPLVEEGDVSGIIFSPNGQFLRDDIVDGPVLIRYATVAGWQAQACAIANRNLTLAEWQQIFATDPYQRVCPHLPVQASPTTAVSTPTTYHGSVHNTTADVISNISLSFTKTGSQIQGTFTVDPPLYGSGTFTGTISATAIQLVVTPEDGSATLTFTGTFQSDGSITGSYVTSGSQAGTWQVVPG
jgi:hypothetical protein